MISKDNFQKIKICIAKVKSAQINANSKRPAMLLELDLGAEANNQHFEITGKYRLYRSSAQILAQHKEADLIGRDIAVVANFPRKQIGSMKSDCLVLGAQDASLPPKERSQSTIVIKSSAPTAPGTLVSINNDQATLTHNFRDLTFAEFLNAQLVVGTVLELTSSQATGVELIVDYGPDLGLRNTITLWANINTEIIGKQIVSLTNLMANTQATNNINSIPDISYTIYQSKKWVCYSLAKLACVIS